MKGCATTKFCPKTAITRGRMASLLVKALHLTATGTGKFKDVPKRHHIRDGHRPTREGRTGHHLREGPLLPGPQDHPGRDRGVPREGHGADRRSPRRRPSAGNPDGSAAIPSEAQLVDTSTPRPRRRRRARRRAAPAAAVVAAVAKGGIITFDCGPDPVTIPLTATAKIFNDKARRSSSTAAARSRSSGRRQAPDPLPEHVRPGAGLDDAHCQDQDHPALTVQHLTFVYGNAIGHRRPMATAAARSSSAAAGFKVVNSPFFGNRCDDDRARTSAARAMRVLRAVPRPAGLRGAQHLRRRRRPAATSARTAARSAASACRGRSSTACSRATRRSARAPTRRSRARPAAATAGPSTTTATRCSLHVGGTRIEDNTANEGGGAIFFVSNDRSGSVEIVDSILRNNTGDGFSTYPGIFFLGQSITFTGSTVE